VAGRHHRRRRIAVPALVVEEDVGPEILNWFSVASAA
jgi:hypothetical protein